MYKYVVQVANGFFGNFSDTADSYFTPAIPEEYWKDELIYYAPNLVTEFTVQLNTTKHRNLGIWHRVIKCVEESS